jgi:hypothetical protein
MNINDEDPINFINEYGVQETHEIKDLVGLRKTCTDDQYDLRFSTCKNCNSCAGNEICTENHQLVRLFCRLEESLCPLNKW